jgi:hypothetical protein
MKAYFAHTTSFYDPYGKFIWLGPHVCITSQKEIPLIQATSFYDIMNHRNMSSGHRNLPHRSSSIETYRNQDINQQHKLLTQNPHPVPSTQQAERASLTREKIPRRASQFSLKINKRQSS